MARKSTLRILGNPRLQFLSQFILGGVFVYASIGKILDLRGFFKILSGYQLLPEFIIKAIAIGLPWIELIFGFFLLLGIFPKKTASVLLILLIIFMIVLSINAIRGIESSCGCFSTNSNTHHSSFWSAIIRDLFFISLGIIIVFFSKKRKLEKI